MRYIELKQYYGNVELCKVIINEHEWRRAGRPSTVQEYETWRLIQDNEVRARHEAERDKAMELEGEYEN